MERMGEKELQRNGFCWALNVRKGESKKEGELTSSTGQGGINAMIKKKTRGHSRETGGKRPHRDTLKTPIRNTGKKGNKGRTSASTIMVGKKMVGMGNKEGGKHTQRNFNQTWTRREAKKKSELEKRTEHMGENRGGKLELVRGSKTKK